MLLELSYLLSNRDINIDEVLRIMAEHLEAQRIIATLINRESGDIIIEGAYGVADLTPQTATEPRSSKCCWNLVTCLATGTLILTKCCE